MSNKTNIEEDIYNKLCIKCNKMFIGKGKSPSMCDKCKTEEAIKILNKFKTIKILYGNTFAMLVEDLEKLQQAIENILADRERLLEENKQSISYQTLCDYLINSVNETQEPIWTEAHIEELLNNFIIKWKEENL